MPRVSVDINFVGIAGRISERAYDAVVVRRLNEHIASISFDRDDGVALPEDLPALSAVRTMQNRVLTLIEN